MPERVTAADPLHRDRRHSSPVPLRMTAAEIAHGHHLGMLGAADLVRMAELAIPASGPVGAALAELEILLPDELDSVEQLVATIDESVEDSADDASRIWLYLSLLSLYDRRASLADPMGELEQIYTDFDYAEEIEGFVPFLPAPAGSEPGRDALEMRWSAYLADRRHELAHRVRPSET